MPNPTAPHQHTPSSDPRTAAKEEKVVTPTESSQGAKIGHMRYVLGFGILFVVAAFALVYLTNA